MEFHEYKIFQINTFFSFFAVNLTSEKLIFSKKLFRNLPQIRHGTVFIPQTMFKVKANGNIRDQQILLKINIRLRDQIFSNAKSIWCLQISSETLFCSSRTRRVSFILHFYLSRRELGIITFYLTLSYTELYVWRCLKFQIGF